MGKSQKSVRIRRDVTDPRARAAIEKAVLAMQKRNESEAANRASRQAAQGAAVSAIMQPIKQLIEADPAAKRSLSSVIALQKERVRRLRRGDFSNDMRTSPNSTVPLTLILRENTTFQFPPYDYQWHWGNPFEFDSDLSTGHFRLLAGTDGVLGVDPTGLQAAGAGIGFRFISDKSGYVDIAPLIQYDWNYEIFSFGIGPWADARGGVDISAWQGSSLVANRHRELFHGHVEAFGGTTSREWDGYVWPPDVTLSFPIAASTWYAISIGGWVECNHCSVVGGADAFGELKGDVRWATVQLWTQ